MELRTDERGYGSASKWLHWLTVAALMAQLTVGYVMDVDDSGTGEAVAGARARVADEAVTTTRSPTGSPTRW